MNTTTYINGKVLTNQTFNDGLEIVTGEGLIQQVHQHDGQTPANSAVVDLQGAYLLPGFIDTQVNGGGGVLFNDQPTVEGIRTIVTAHRQFGTTGLLPTLISDELDVIRTAQAAVQQAITEGISGVLGIHIEGPFLNVERRGIHDANKVCQLTAEIIDELEPLSGGTTVLTLAPETVAPEWVRRLTDKGFIVCAGHSNARQDEVRAALDHGLRGFTHLYNAMSQLTAREPGVVGQALVDPESWCGMIADGYHVSPTAMEIALRCKGVERLMLVTDAMPPVGSLEPSFDLFGKHITVHDGICRDEAGTLAGTALDMATAARNMARLTRCSFAEACTMASSTPAEFLRISEQRGTIKPGHTADFVIMDENLLVTSTISGGVAYPN